MGYLSCGWGECREPVYCLRRGERLFPILIDGDVDNEDGMTKKTTISRVDKDVAGLDICQWTRLHLAAGWEGAGNTIESAEIAVKGSRDAPKDWPLTSWNLILLYCLVWYKYSAFKRMQASAHCSALDSTGRSTTANSWSENGRFHRCTVSPCWLWDSGVANARIKYSRD